jgi:ppGpp synthetase/RelA/SpoT-type nucleotidyltranferase
MTKKTDTMDLERLLQEYQSIVALADQISSAVNNELQEGLKSAKIQLGFPIESRIKQWESIKEKLQRISLSVNQISDLQDIIGFRLILIFSRDVFQVGRIITERFDVIRQYDTKERLKDDQFGYSSIHYVVKLKRETLIAHDLQFIPQLLVEIQVRTLAQHLWAEASRILQYKQEKAIPREISRDLHRVSALLETVDLDFEKVLKKRDDYRAGVVALDSNAELNVDLLEITLNSFWPEANKTDKENYYYLLEYLKHRGITTQSQLTQIIRKQRDEVLRRSAREAEYLRNIIKIHPLHNGSIIIHEKNKRITHGGITSQLIDRVEKGIFFGHVALTVTAVQFDSGERNPLDPIE